MTLKHHLTLESMAKDDWALWAFGDIWVDYLVLDADSYDLMNAWNSRHGDILMLQDDGVPVVDLKKMEELYGEHLSQLALQPLSEAPN